MAVAGAFGLAGGTRGVDHVGEVFAVQGDAWVGVAVALEGRLTQHQGFQALGNRQLLTQMRLGQQQLHTAVVQHVGQAFTRVFRVQRHVGATGLEHREQADHHLDGTLHCQAHQYVRPYAGFDQAVGQAVGAAVQLGVAQALLGKYQCRGAWRARHLLFNQLMHAVLQRVVPRRGVPVLYHLPAFGHIEHRQFAEALLAALEHGLQQVEQMAAVGLHRVRVEVRTRKAELHRQRVTDVHQHRQREVGLLAGLRQAKTDTAAATLFQGLGHRVVLEHQDIVEQGFTALPGPALDIVQPGVFMLAQGQVLRLHPLQPVGHGLLALHCADHRQGIDEQANLLLHPHEVCRAPGHGGAERHHRLPAMALQQDQPRRLDQGVERDFMAAGEGLEATRQRAIQAQRVLAMPVRRHGLAAAQASRRLQCTQLLAPEGFGRTGITLLQPTDVIAIAPGRFGHRHAGVTLQHFTEQARIAPTVHQDVMACVDQLMALLVGTHQHQTDQGRLGQLKALATLGLLQVLQRQLRLRHGAPVEKLDGQPGLAVHHLAWPLQLALPEKPAAQHVMGLHRGIPGLLEARHIQALGRHADLVDVVAGGLFVQGVEQHALLHGRQGVDVVNPIGGQRQGLKLMLVQA